MLDCGDQHPGTATAFRAGSQRDFRFLTDPLFLASSVFGKKPDYALVLAGLSPRCISAAGALS